MLAQPFGGSEGHAGQRRGRIVRNMTRLSVAPLLGVLLCGSLTACGPKGQGTADLTARVLFTANGSLDAQADTRDRMGGGLRRVRWSARPPLDARRVTVLYDSGARPLAWEMRIEAPRFTAEDVAGKGARRVGTPDGEALRPQGGRLREVLVVKTKNGLHLLTRGYEAQRAQAFLPAFGAVP